MTLRLTRRRVTAVPPSRLPDYGGRARVLIARYAPRRATARRLSLPLVRRALHANTTIERHLRAAMNLTVRLTVVSRRIGAMTARAASLHGTSPRDVALPAVTRLAMSPLAVPEPRRAPLPLRLVARMTRVEVMSPSPSSWQAAQPPNAALPLAPRRPGAAGALPVVRPASIAVPPAGDVTVDREHARPAAVSEPAARSGASSRAAAAPAIDAAELQRLASRVIASIDDRIAAARERLGRC